MGLKGNTERGLGCVTEKYYKVLVLAHCREGSMSKIRRMRGEDEGGEES